MQRVTINRIIQEKVQNAQVDENVKDFVTEVLVFELSNLHIERVHYGKDIDSMILKHLRSPK